MEADHIPHSDIERYLLDKMGRHERAGFEEQMAGNDALRQEVAFQNEVIKGISEARKRQLKARLADIPVSTSPIPGLLNSAWIKAVSGVVVVSAAAILTYHMLDEGDPPLPIIDENEQIVADAPQLPEVHGLVIPDKTPTPEEPALTNSPVIKEHLHAVAEMEKVATEPNESDQAEPMGIVVPGAVMPEPVVDYSEDNTEDALLPLVTGDDDPVISLQVEQYPGSPQYRYFDGALTLRGDFQGIAYQLLEIHGPDGKAYFIQLGKNYYELPATDTFKPFVPVTNPKKIKELDMLSEME